MQIVRIAIGRYWQTLGFRALTTPIRGQSERLDVFARIPHRDFPGGRTFRTPMLVAAMAWYKLRDALW